MSDGALAVLDSKVAPKVARNLRAWRLMREGSVVAGQYEEVMEACVTVPEDPGPHGCVTRPAHTLQVGNIEVPVESVIMTGTTLEWQRRLVDDHEVTVVRPSKGERFTMWCMPYASVPASMEGVAVTLWRLSWTREGQP